MSRLPIFHDDYSFHDRQANIFEDMRRQMGSGFGGGRSMGHPFDDPFNRLCDDFYQLRPRDHLSRVRKTDDIGGSRESLDENSLKSLFIEDPVTKSRRFQISFDVKDYNPQEVALKMQDDTLLVEAKSEKLKDGNKMISEFSRKVKIPPEVEADKITSMLSTDGVLTITAPVPPTYQSITDGPAKTTAQIQAGRNSPSMSSPHSPGIKSSVGRNSPLSSVHSPLTSSHSPLSSPKITTKSISRTQPSLSSPPTTTPTYKKQIYMVPTPVSNPTVAAKPHFNHQNGGVPITVKTTMRAKTPPLDTPTFYNTDKGCEMILMMEVGSPYTPDDLLVKVDGRNLIVEAEHVEVMNGKKSKSSISREFELSELVDPQTVTALLKDGRLKITGLAQV